MLGLFGLLNLGTRSLGTSRQGLEVAGHNLANVNNPAYARQRLTIATSPGIPDELGAQGTGVEAVAIVRLRNGIVDDQIQRETSVRGSLEAQQTALEFAQAGLGQQIDRLAAGAEPGSAGASHSLADGLNELFNAFQSLSTNPASMGERQILLTKASSLASQFNQLDGRLETLSANLNQSLQEDVSKANALLTEIADLNERISAAEFASDSPANDLRDTRQDRIEQLAGMLKIDLADAGAGSLNLSVAGTLLVSGSKRIDSLELYDPGGGQLLVRAASTGTPLALTAGSLQGNIAARDGALRDLRENVNSLAGALITQVNVIHSGGFSLTGSTGAPFFSGANAGDIRVNSALLDNPALVQAAGISGASGDNQVALSLAQLSETAHPLLGNQTFNQAYGHTVAAFGQELSSINTQVSDQQVVEKMLAQRRDSISGVSLDEEMADLTKFQRAFEASARLISTVDELFDAVMNM